MNNSICLNINDCSHGSLEEKYGLMYNYDSSYSFDVYVTENEKFEDIIRDYDKMYYDFSKYYELCKQLYNDGQIDFDMLQAVEKYTDKNIYQSVFENIQTIYISGDYKDIQAFLKNNPTLSSKKIVLFQTLSFENQLEINNVIKYLKEFDNLYVHLDGNVENISVIELEATNNKINEMYSKIKQYKLSPLEILIYAYDMDRDRLYIKEDEKDSGTVSRDISKVLLGDKIVCVGFAKIYDTLLKKAGFNTDFDYLTSNDKDGHGHVRNIVYVKDDKYDIEGVYYFDPTFDNKKNDDDNNFFNSFKCFARTKNNMLKRYRRLYKNITFDYLDSKFINEVIAALKSGGIIKLPTHLTSKINKLSRLIDGKNMIDTLLYRRFVKGDKTLNKEILDNLFRYERLFDKPIKYNKILTAIYNVRKIEYYENPEKHSLCEADFKLIYQSLNDLPVTSEERLLAAIFGTTINDDLNFEDFIDKFELSKKIAQIRLTMLLKSRLNNGIKKK